MSYEKECGYGGTDDEAKYDRCYWRRVGFVIFAAMALAFILAPLSGCATAPAEPEVRVCFMQMMGRTEQGTTVVAQQCMTPEAFAETQK